MAEADSDDPALRRFRVRLAAGFYTLAPDAALVRESG